MEREKEGERREGREGGRIEGGGRGERKKGQGGGCTEGGKRVGWGAVGITSHLQKMLESNVLETGKERGNVVIGVEFPLQIKPE